MPRLCHGFINRKILLFIIQLIWKYAAVFFAIDWVEVSEFSLKWKCPQWGTLISLLSRPMLTVLLICPLNYIKLIAPETRQQHLKGNEVHINFGLKLGHWVTVTLKYPPFWKSSIKTNHMNLKIIESVYLRQNMFRSRSRSLFVNDLGR